MNPDDMAEMIGDKEKAPCRFIEGIHVTERLTGEVAWDGVVLVFGLDRPPEEICYGWIDPITQRLVTVLNRPPVESPQTAVRANIMGPSRMNYLPRILIDWDDPWGTDLYDLELPCSIQAFKELGIVVHEGLKIRIVGDRLEADAVVVHHEYNYHKVWCAKVIEGTLMDVRVASRDGSPA